VEVTAWLVEVLGTEGLDFPGEQPSARSKTGRIIKKVMISLIGWWRKLDFNCRIILQRIDYLLAPFVNKFLR
jgi:hypothetical protein